MHPSHDFHRALEYEHPLGLHADLALLLLGQTGLDVLYQEHDHVRDLFVHDVDRPHGGFSINFVGFYVKDRLNLGHVCLFGEEVLQVFH